MLTHIHIQNFTIIEHLDLELKPNLTVLTGETGAGKSIILDALELTLGGRADGGMIRNGHERCEISASFDISNIPTAQQWLIERDLDVQDFILILRRVITSDGRSRGYIQNQPVPIQSLRELGALLVNIHGQHEHQILLKREKQQHLLDAYAGLRSLAQQVAKHYTEWRTSQETLEQFRAAAQARSARSELLRYQIQELDTLGLVFNEIELLEQEYKQLTHAEQLLKEGHIALNYLKQDDNSALSLLHRTQKLLHSLQAVDQQASSLSLETAILETQETGHALQAYLEKLEVNPERLSFVEQRLQTIHDLARKHQIQPNDLLRLHQQFIEEYKQLENADTQCQILDSTIQEQLNLYQTLAIELSQKRQKAAEKISQKITQYMHGLGMPGGQFQAQLEPISQQPNIHGLEQALFLVNTNPGQTLQPLSKVVSGGELSRISLAIQLIRAQDDDTPTLVFDEVDVGIGGGTAEMVGKLLRKLGATTQVLCVTHLPQVAAQGHHHLHVNKQAIENSTITQIKWLSADEKIQEVARMLGGLTITQQTLAHAKEMLEL